MTERLFNNRRKKSAQMQNSLDHESSNNARIQNITHNNTLYSADALELKKLNAAAKRRERDLISKKLNQMDGMNFIKKGIFPQIQQLLNVPPQQAREGFITIMSNIGLQGMLLLASVIGPAMDVPVGTGKNWNNEENFYYSPLMEKCPNITLAYSFIMKLTVICAIVVTISTIWFVNDMIVVPDEEVHGVCVKADRLVYQCWCMTNAFYLTQTCVLLRAWMFYYTSYEVLDVYNNSNLYFYLFIAATVGAVVIIQGVSFNCFEHYTNAYPISATYWVKAIAPYQYKAKQEMRSREAVRRFTLQTRKRFGLLGTSGYDNGTGAGNEHGNKIEPEIASRSSKINGTQIEIQGMIEQYLGSKNDDVLLTDKDEFLEFLKTGKNLTSLPSTYSLLATRMFDEFIERHLEDCDDEFLDDATTDNEAHKKNLF